MLERSCWDTTVVQLDQAEATKKVFFQCPALEQQKGGLVIHLFSVELKGE